MAIWAMRARRKALTRQVFVPAGATPLAHWQVHLTRAESLVQPIGIYMIDAAIEVNGDTIITEPIFVELEGSGVRGVTP